MTREYPYRLRRKLLGAFAFVSLALAVLCGVIASDNDRGLIIGRVISLSPEGATVFYWASATVSLIAFVAMVGVAICSSVLHQRIVVSETGIIIPESRWSSEEVTVPFLDILDVETVELPGRSVLAITHTRGTFELSAWMLPNESSFREISEAVDKGVDAAGMKIR